MHYLQWHSGSDNYVTFHESLGMGKYAEYCCLSDSAVTWFPHQHLRMYFGENYLLAFAV